MADFDGSPTALVVRGLDDSYGGSFSTTAGSETRVNVDTTTSGGTTAIAGATANISTSITPQNDAPALGNNSLTLSEGATVVLSVADLSATDVDNADPSLIFTVSNVANGQFVLSGVPTTTFTQADVTANIVSFVHDGSEAAPSYDVEVSDGALTTGPAAATITFTNQNDAPVLGNNSLTLSEGATVVLTAADLSATDVDSPDPSLNFTVSNVVNGQFLLSGAPTTTFTQADVTGNLVSFVHDGSEAAPSYDVEVSDGALTTGPVAATITFTDQNDAPVLGNNSLTLSEGATVVLSVADLSATDVDNADPSLIFTVSNVVNGQFCSPAPRPRPSPRPMSPGTSSASSTTAPRPRPPTTSR